MVGRPVLRSDEKVQGIQIRDIMVGDDASKARQNLKINLPMGMLVSLLLPASHSQKTAV